MSLDRIHGALAATAIATLAAALVAPVQAQTPPAASPLHARIAPVVAGMYPSLETLYKDLHAHPEIAFQEVKTAARMAEEMRKLGFEVTEKIGKTGVVAIYRNGPGPTVMVRTELDALPMEEKTGLPYASRVKTEWNGRETFVAHSCGHDIHMASWVGTARTLLALKDQWKGTLMFVAQPAEEGTSGAKAMIADGLFKRFPLPDHAFALHTSPSPYGYVGYRVGAVTSNSDSMEITFKGQGGHGSAPDKTIDPIAIAARFVTDVQTVVSREKDPAEFGVVTVGAIQGGTVGNIIPDTVTLRGTIRSYKPEVREKLLAGVRRTANAAATMGGAPEPAVALVPGGMAVVNDEAVVGRTVGALKAALGDAQVVAVPPITASEDFSEFVNAGVPSMFFFVGVLSPQEVADSRKPGGKPLAFNHSPFFAPVPEPSIRTGVEAMSVAVMTTLAAN
ncbi:amidohydrolase [Variovorax sp. PvP013]|uniref:amidohydrolase n=1 Tax=Variovorax sp. PvP013 TaxID=3156435 RepID=UPI003D23C52C